MSCATRAGWNRTMKYLWSIDLCETHFVVENSRNKSTRHVHTHLLRANSVISCANHCWSYVQARFTVLKLCTQCCTNLIKSETKYCAQEFNFSNPDSHRNVSAVRIGTFPRNEVLAFGATKPCSHALSKSSTPGDNVPMSFSLQTSHMHQWMAADSALHTPTASPSNVAPNHLMQLSRHQLYYVNGFANLNEPGSLWYFFENRNTLKLERFVARSPFTSPSRKNMKKLQSQLINTDR